MKTKMLLLLLNLISHISANAESRMATTDNDGKSTKIVFDYKSMTYVFDTVRLFIHEIQPYPLPIDALSDEDLTSVDSLLTNVKHNYNKWLEYEQGFVIVAAVCILLSFLFTIGAMIYFCWWYCCRNSAKQEKYPLKNAACLRNCWSFVLTLFTVVLVFSVTCGFISNQYAHDGASLLPKRLLRSIDDFSKYRSWLGNEVQVLFKSDFEQFEVKALKLLNNVDKEIVEQIKREINATALDELKELSNQTKSVDRQVEGMKMKLTDIKTMSVNTHTQLNSTFDKINTYLATCSSSKCVTMQEIVSNIQNNFEHSQFREAESKIDTLLRAIDQIEQSSISLRLEEGLDKVDEWKRTLSSKTTEATQIIKDHLAGFKLELEDISASFVVKLSQLDTSDVREEINRNSPYFINGERYRWIGSFVVVGLIGLIVVLLAFGICFGVCGNSAGDYKDNDCCIREIGAKFLCGAITIGVLTMLILMIVSVSLFIFGGNVENSVCQSARNPDLNNGIVELINRLKIIYSSKQNGESDSSNIGSTTTNTDSFTDFINEIEVSALLHRCSKNESLYSILNIRKHINFDAMDKYKQQAEEKKDEIIEAIESIDMSDFKNVKFLSSDDLTQLQRISEINVNVHELEMIRKMINFDELLTNFKKYEQQLTQMIESSSSENKPLLKAIRSTLQDINKVHILPLVQLTGEFVDSAERIQPDIEKLTSRIPQLTMLLANATQKMQDQPKLILKQSTVKVADRLFGLFKGYVSHVYNELNVNIASCRPLMDLINSVLLSVCDATLNPFNGFWASAMISLLLLIPSLMISCTLRKYYSESQYPGVIYIQANNTSYKSASRTSNNNQNHHSRNRKHQTQSRC